jgi:Tol biopolymer transport system component
MRQLRMDVLAWGVGCLLAATPRATAQGTTRISVDSSGAEADGDSGLATSSADGRFVAFVSGASNLVSGDTNGSWDVFVHDRLNGTTERVSTDSSGAEGNGQSGLRSSGAVAASITSDGRFVAFVSAASNLIASDANGCIDVFVHDRLTGVTERASVDSSGLEGDLESSLYPVISADGRFVAFASLADDLVAGDTNGSWDVFVRDRSTGVTERASVDSSGLEGDWASGGGGVAISSDGAIVAFSSQASNLVPGDTNYAEDVFVHDCIGGSTSRVSVDSSGGESELDSPSWSPSVSADGQVVAFHSDAANLVAGDTNDSIDVFVHDGATGITERVSESSPGVEADFGGENPSISADGLIVAFDSYADDLVAGDSNGYLDAFVHERTTGITERVSVDSSGLQADLGGQQPSISPDGQVVVFGGSSTNLVPGDTNWKADVFAHERASVAATWSSYGAGFPGTNGVPAFTSRANPVLGTTLTLDLQNSSGSSTTAFLVLGLQRVQVHSHWGGDFLVDPFLDIVVGLAPAGETITGDLPRDASLYGVAVDLQAIEADAGAARGVSFTPGLELVLGR